MRGLGWNPYAHDIGVWDFLPVVYATIGVSCFCLVSNWCHVVEQNVQVVERLDFSRKIACQVLEQKVVLVK